MESGILPALETFMALRADNWLHNYGDLDTPLGLAIKNKICATFRPEDPKWFSAIKDKALNTIDQVVKAFAY